MPAKKRKQKRAPKIKKATKPKRKVVAKKRRAKKSALKVLSKIKPKIKVRVKPWAFSGVVILIVIAFLATFLGHNLRKDTDTSDKKGKIITTGRTYQEAITGKIDGKTLSIEDRKAVFESVMVDLEKKLLGQPEDIALLSQLVSVYYNLGNLEKTEEILKKVIALSPQNSSFTLTLANLLRDSGRVEEAERYYKETLKIDPQNVAAKNNLQALKK